MIKIQPPTLWCLCRIFIVGACDKYVNVIYLSSYCFCTANSHEIQTDGEVLAPLSHHTQCPEGLFFFLLVQSVSLVPEPLLCNSQHFLLSKSAQTFATLCCPHVRSDFKDRLSFLLAALLLHSRVLSTFLGVTPLGPVTHCSLMRQLIRAPLALAVLHHHYLEWASPGEVPPRRPLCYISW